MGCTGISICESDFPSNVLSMNKTTRLVNMAFEMKNFIDKFSTGKGLRLKLKIGIHKGNVIAGIIGEHKPQFSLIGDTVNTTSRVCSTGESGQITLSEESVKDLDSWNFKMSKKIVEAKGKGVLNVFQIEKRSFKIISKFQTFTNQIIKNTINEDSPSRNFMRRNSQRSIVTYMKSKKLDTFSSIMRASLIADENEKIFSKKSVKNDHFLKLKQKNVKTTPCKRTIRNKFTEQKEEEEEDTLRIEKRTLPSLRNFIQILKSKSFLETQDFKLMNIISFLSIKEKTKKFMQQLIRKYSFEEKIILFGLWIHTLIRTFLLLSLLQFFDVHYCLFIAISFLFLLGISLIFKKEFYKTLMNIPFTKFYLLIFFSLDVVSNILELFHSNLAATFIPSFINMAIIYMIFSNLWYYY